MLMEPPHFSNLAPCPKQAIPTGPNNGHEFERVGAFYKPYDGNFIMWQCGLCRRCVVERANPTGVIKQKEEETKKVI